MDLTRYITVMTISEDFVTKPLDAYDSFSKKSLILTKKYEEISYEKNNQLIPDWKEFDDLRSVFVIQF
jgi:hypothetical protein